MSCSIQINSISGTSPFDVYFCDNLFYQCILVDTLVSPTFPVSIELPTQFIGTTYLTIKVIDNNGCQSFIPITFPTATPTPTISLTPSLTPTLTPTPTPTSTSP